MGRLLPTVSTLVPVTKASNALNALFTNGEKRYNCKKKQQLQGRYSFTNSCMEDINIACITETVEKGQPK